jgi:aminoglycoside phosphotransferase (APT) family kinase protein
LEGESATNGHVSDLVGFATTLAQFLRALQEIDAAGGPQPGEHNFFRGGPLTVYDAETRRAIAALGGEIDGDNVTALWEEAIGSKWHGVPVWLHGDVSASNLLVRSGRLSAVIDFGCCGVGDPSCDLTIAWTFFAGQSRESFRAELPLDGATWARARGWALWKALITLASLAVEQTSEAEAVRRVIDDVIADRRAAA